MAITVAVAMGITCSHTLAVCWLTFNRSCLASCVGSHQGWRIRLSCRRLSINRSSMAIIDQRLSMALLGDISIAVSADVAIYNHQDVQPLSKRDSKRVMKKLKNILSSPSQLAIISETILRALKYYPQGVVPSSDDSPHATEGCKNLGAPPSRSRSRECGTPSETRSQSPGEGNGCPTDRNR